MFALCFSGVAFGALDSTLSSAYLPDILRTFAPNGDEGELGRVGAYINFAFLIGSGVGGMGLSALADHLGRRAVFALALLCYGVSSGVGAVATSWEWLAVSRVGVGVGVGTALVVSAVILTEAWPAASRAVVLGVLSVAYPVGIIASGLVVAQVPSWRVALGAGAVPAVLALPAWVVVQDSTAWRAVRFAVSASVRSPERLGDYWREVSGGVLIYGTMLIGLWATFAWLPTWVESRLTGAGSSGGAAEASASAAQALRASSVILLGAGGLIGGPVSGFFANRFGRQPVQAACFVLCFGLSFLLFRVSDGFSWHQQAGILALGLCFGVSQGVLNAFVPALFPAALAGTATALCFHAGRVLTAFAVFFVGALVVWFGGYGSAMFAFAQVYLLGLAAMWWLHRVSVVAAAERGLPAARSQPMDADRS